MTSRRDVDIGIIRIMALFYVCCMAHQVAALVLMAGKPWCIQYVVVVVVLDCGGDNNDDVAVAVSYLLFVLLMMMMRMMVVVMRMMISLHVYANRSIKYQFYLSSLLVT